MSSSDDEFDDWLQEISDRFDTAVGASIDVEAELEGVKRRAAAELKREREATHRTLVMIDVEGYGNRSTVHRMAIRQELDRILDEALQAAGIDRSLWHIHDAGDGALMVGPGNEPAVAILPTVMAAALREHKEKAVQEERIRLRMAMHAGEVVVGDHGPEGAAIIQVSRLLDSMPLRAALRESPGELAVIVSDRSYDDVIRQHSAGRREIYRPVSVMVKDGNEIGARIGLPDVPREPATSESATRFEHRYVDYVREDTATFELFQVTQDEAPARVSFDEFFVVPSIARRRTWEQSPQLTGMGVEPAKAIAESRQVLITAGTGSGKTNTMLWLTHLVATRHREEGPWHRVVPFYLPLRRLVVMPRKPEELLDLTAPALKDEKPDSWVTNLFTTGRALLMVDGLDEVVEGQRENVKRWLETMVETYPEARYVVTARPSGVDDTWLSSLVRFDLLGLSSAGLERMIDRWYAAAIKRETNPRTQAWLLECGTRLWERLSTRPRLRSLVSSPLLASLICALYRQNDQHLPRTHHELIKRALDLSLERWDQQETETLTRSEKRSLLERLAASMMRGSELVISRDDARTRVEGSKHDEHDVALSTLLKTGVLREVHDDWTDGFEFAHRTFRDYLAAAEMVRTGTLDTLVDHAHEDSWHEVVFFAAAQASEQEAADLLTRLLRRAAEPGIDRATATHLTLVAAACLDYVPLPEWDRARLDVEHAVRDLIPPANLFEAELLAKAGSFVLGLLPEPSALADRPDRAEISARVVRTLAMVGGEEAREKIRLYALRYPTVLDELLRGWRQFDFSEEYAVDVLSHVDFGDQVYEVRRWDMLPRLRHLGNLRNLRLVGNVPLTDGNSDPLADLTALRRLELVSNEIVHDLTPLVHCRSLRELRLSGYSRLRDLSTLARTSVERLELRTTSRTSIDLGTLASLTTLRELVLENVSEEEAETARAAVGINIEVRTRL